jgi:hypothetical protein
LRLLFGRIERDVAARRRANSAKTSEVNRTVKKANTRAKMLIMARALEALSGGRVLSQRKVNQGREPKKRNIRAKPSDAMRTAAASDLMSRFRRTFVSGAAFVDGFKVISN